MPTGFYLWSLSSSSHLEIRLDSFPKFSQVVCWLGKPRGSKAGDILMAPREPLPPLLSPVSVQEDVFAACSPPKRRSWWALSELGSPSSWDQASPALGWISTPDQIEFQTQDPEIPPASCCNNSFSVRHTKNQQVPRALSYPALWLACFCFMEGLYLWKLGC